MIDSPIGASDSDVIGGAYRAAAKTKATDRATGVQTLMRGLNLVDAVARSTTITLPALAKQVGLSRSTTHRLATAMVERRMLSLAPRKGYSLGPKLLELGYFAGQQMDLVRVARPFLEKLLSDFEDTVHLGVLDENRVLYLDQLTGRRRVNVSARVGDRQPIRSTGLGRALVLGQSEARWRELYRLTGPPTRCSADEDQWIASMHGFAKRGAAFDFDENDDCVSCVAAPIRSVSGQVVGAVSVSGAAQYMDGKRMNALLEDVISAANAIGRELGWNGARAHPTAL